MPDMNATIRLAACLLLAGASLPPQAQDPAAYGAASERSRAVAERYFAAYVAKDWRGLGELLAEDGSYADRTAELVFGNVLHKGKEAVLRFFGSGYADVQMRYHPMRTIFTGHYAVFEGNLDWSMGVASGKTVKTDAMPFVVILRIENGLVVEHRDYADYHPFMETLRKSRPPSARPGPAS